MSLFKRSKINFEEDGGRTPVKFSQRESRDPSKIKKKRKIKRILITFFILSILSALGIFGIKGYNAIRNVFEGETGILNLFEGSYHRPLDGEADGRVNFLLLGVGDEGHSGSTLSDTMIIVSLDTRKKAVAMFSIPRDLYVKIPGYGYNKLNAAHAFGERDHYAGGGPALAKKTLEETFDMKIHYWGRADFSGLADIVDALGGVTVDVERSFCDYSYPVERKGDSRKVCFNAGSQNMNGTKALQYARSRHALGPEGSDFARSKRQQKLLVAIKEKTLSTYTAFNPKKVLDILSVLGNHVKTDLEMSEIARLYDFSKDIPDSKIINKNLTNGSDGYLVSSSSAAGYILQPKGGDYDEIQALIRNIFDEMGVREENASISLLNGTYNTGLAKTLAENMKADGYNIQSTGNADKRNYTKTVIYDYSNGKKNETIRALESKFNVTAIRTSAEGATTDIKVIVGSSFKSW